MPRSKVKLAFIEDSKARKNSFMKRKECLKNKLKELSILCGIEACAIMYSSYEPKLEVWPDDNNVFQNVLNAFLTKSPMERSKFMLNQDSYVKERMNKVKEKINKQIIVNREMVMANLLSECLSGEVLVAGLNLTDLNDIVALAGYKLSEIEERIMVLKSEADAGARPPQPQEVVGGSNTKDVDLYVPVMEDASVDGMQTTAWYPPDWISNHLQHELP